jgi:heterotetrameric sarcosine oxidase delta subunit
MLLIECPYCGKRDHTEFNYGGDAGVTRPAMAAPQREWVDYVYFRDNPRGAHLEYWHHVQGCRQWLCVIRNTLTHEITRVTFAAKRQELS